ncbi:CHASE2 domain-containing protein [Trichocoleus desertorum]|uniref:CHASE2 domain-containing protein n=1 Tax=Trichocoleus desertorum GB2-A4 TaxID=2933944 RepID=A0ABV0JFQ5_9CYAN|nr:CHASE2 domain-containing protein [Trichocoleus sp. FACHB-46]
MSYQLWKTLQAELKIWRRSALPGLVVIVGVVLVRLTGGLQFLELVALDQLLRSRPSEPTDERIVIVGITEADIQRAKTYPIPDGVIAALINQLQTYQPAVIGLDIVRDLPVEPGHAALDSVFRTQANVIGAEIALPDRSGYTVAPPPALPPEQVGFADVPLDGDGYQRRSLLGAHDRQEEYHFSFTMQVAKAYLATKGIELNNGIRDPEAMRFDSVELTRVQPNTGGYVKGDAGGNQILLNVRSGRQPFRVLSLAQIQAGQVDPDWLRGKMVLIGVMSFSAKDLASSGAIVGIDPGRIHGVEMQAHAISQITSAVLDNRPLLKVWGEGWEYLWIISWGVIGISLGRWLRPGRLLLALAVVSGSLIGLSYGAILLGWWIPLVPALLGLVLNGAGLTAALFYRHEQELRSRLEERQFVIQQIFDAIHSEPLQLLSKVLREEQAQDQPSPLLSDLQRMKQEIYAIFGSAQRKVFDEAGNLQLGGEIEFALQAPLHELLYRVYINTLERDLPHFSHLKFKIVQFEPLDTQHLRLEHKRALCRFLEEALCNVGKYAEGATRLTVICQREDNQQVIRITDNGRGLAGVAAEMPEQSLARKFPQLKFKSSRAGMGTQLAENLARQLGGSFRRYPNNPKGLVCELTWPKQKRWWR